MSRSKLHKDKGKWNNGYQENISSKLLNFFTRHNNDWGEFRKAKKDLEDKIAEKELETEIKEILEEGTDCDNPVQDNILVQIMGRL